MNDRIGEERINNFGSKMIVTNYRNYKDIDVYFPKYDYTKEHVGYGDFKKGEISCAYEPRVFGVACVGEGEYKVSKNGKCTKCYKTWNHMLERCYSKKFQERNPTYIDCSVSEDWLNFQVFGKWFDENYYNIGEEVMSLDKDILMKGNKIYSPQTCVFVPQRINLLFTKNNIVRGDSPIGVSYKNKKYKAYCNVDRKKKSLGYYDTPEEAFQAYKQYKEQYIKEVADQYKNVIPQKLYEAMIKYQVEIDD